MKNVLGGLMLFVGLGALFSELRDYSSISDIPLWNFIIIFVLVSGGARIIIKGYVSEVMKESKKEFDKQIEQLRSDVTYEIRNSAPKVKDTRSIDDLYQEAHKVVSSEGGTTMYNVHRKINVDLPTASKITSMLEENGVIGTMDNKTKFHKIILKK